MNAISSKQLSATCRFSIVWLATVFFPALADTVSPRLSQVGISPAAAGLPPFFTGTVTDGPADGTAWLQASVDLGVADPWTDIATTSLDNLGAATFSNVADARPQAAAAQRGFFRVTTSADPYVSQVPDGFALIPAGIFQMGDQSDPRVGDDYEVPVHSVYVSAFYMGKHEITNELWDDVRAWGVNHGYTDLAFGNGYYASKGANHPVHSITWYDTVKWCNARSQKEGLTPCYTVSGSIYKTGYDNVVDCNWNASGYRLPSEAEWEKAARGGLSGKNFPWGDTITHSQANYNSYSSFAYDVSPTRGYHPAYAVGGYPYSSPVGSFAPNRYGLYDMAGNMLERCWDWYASYPPTSQTDPRGPASGGVRVNRGGSWDDNAYLCRAARRNNNVPGYTSRFLGFRIARSSVP